MIRIQHIPLTPLIALALGLVLLIIAASPTLADGPTVRQQVVQRSNVRAPLVLPVLRNHRRNTISHQVFPKGSSIELPAPIKNTKVRLLCPGCPGDERTSMPKHTSSEPVSPRVYRPGPPHPPPIIDDGDWPRPEWPANLSDQLIIIHPPPRDDLPIPSRPHVLRIKPKRR